MAFTSDRIDGILPRKHADAAAIGQIMPPVDCAVRQTAERRLVLLVHNGNDSLFPVVPQRHEDGADVVDVMLRRTDDRRVVRHGSRTGGVPY